MFYEQLLRVHIPKGAKRHQRFDCVFAPLRYVHIIASCKKLVKFIPDLLRATLRTKNNNNLKIDNFDKKST
jgi:hypothetical protein